MMTALMLLALLAPWLALATVPSPRAAPLALAPLPLLVLGLVGEGTLNQPQLLLGTVFAVDAINQPLLILAGVGWSLAGAFVPASVERGAPRFACFWLLTLAGQSIALLAAELASFYAGYSLMTLAACGLVVHRQTEQAWRAGRVYLVLALAGEMAIIAGLVMLAATVGNARFDQLPGDLLASLGPARWLLLAGFSVKLGIMPLHVWLPLAHPVAPVAASAVLSGLLVKAGLLGMLRLLPADTLPGPQMLVALGLLTAAFGALVGLSQQRLKTALAYSTISQMGLALAGFGALQAGKPGPAAAAALGLFALHHGINKLALFLAAGHLLRSRLAHLLFLLPALALAGLPLSSGALAKDALKHVYKDGALDQWLLALSLSSALTSALLLHAYRLACAQTHGRVAVHPAWAAAVLAGVIVPWGWASAPIAPAAVWSGLWPVMLGVALYMGGARLLGGRRLSIPEGDLLIPFEWVAHRLLRSLAVPAERWRRWQPPDPALLPGRHLLSLVERTLLSLPMVGFVLLLLLLLLWRVLAAA